ncbi:hypothetical protein [Nitrospina watsonii]|uniref:Ferritin-like diiron domain-containing protein n=1 Tax=Nitrospina watsonii TaxID=1323948 RepID=A0ABN8VZ29_9BACT|nr:hypothetical protein [Nitrospina watsonii]CAI2719014.1 conserved protein of unknown function [Nitrospina watsonii]
MADSIQALKQAVEFERSALEQYQIALKHATHKETQEALQGYITDKEQKIDTLSWFIMAESGSVETSSESEAASGEASGGASKCPFSKQLADMGIDITQMKPPTFE